MREEILGVGVGRNQEDACAHATQKAVNNLRSHPIYRAYFFLQIPIAKSLIDGTSELKSFCQRFSSCKHDAVLQASLVERNPVKKMWTDSLIFDVDNAKIELGRFTYRAEKSSAPARRMLCRNILIEFQKKQAEVVNAYFIHFRKLLYPRQFALVEGSLPTVLADVVIQYLPNHYTYNGLSLPFSSATREDLDDEKSSK